MFDYVAGKLRQAVAIGCVAITCLFCVQATLINLDRIEHTLEIEHEASPLAGAVQSCADVPDACGQTDETGHPVSHAHLGDTLTTVLPVSDTALATVMFIASGFPLGGDQSGPGPSQLAPDRPPKA